MNTNLTASGNGTFTNGSVMATNFLLSQIKWVDSPVQFSWTAVGANALSEATLTAPFNGIGGLALVDGKSLNGQCQIGHNVAPSNAANASLYTEVHGHAIGTTAPSAAANRTYLDFYYAPANIGGTLYGPITNTLELVVSANTHHLVECGHLTYSNWAPNISAMYYLTIARRAHGTSNYTGGLIISADVHYPIDRLGSASDNAP